MRFFKPNTTRHRPPGTRESEMRPMAQPETSNVFVYGTYMKDCVRHIQIQQEVTSWGRAEIIGKLYQIPTGAPLVVEETPVAAPVPTATATAPAPTAPPPAPSKVYGEVMTFQNMDSVLDTIDAHEGYLPGNVENSRMIRKVVEVTLTSTGEKIKAYAWFFPKEKFNPKNMFAVHCHGGDWRKFVMMPRYDGYQH